MFHGTRLLILTNLTEFAATLRFWQIIFYWASHITITGPDYHYNDTSVLARGLPGRSTFV
ncbi:MAG: hypothetical protein O2960_28810 [Verrucomicrobia bacterium]|nr:hypothetical protein [Verrucomicrobiota bacterium]